MDHQQIRLFDEQIHCHLSALFFVVNLLDKRIDKSEFLSIKSSVCLSIGQVSIEEENSISNLGTDLTDQ
jgi:hypothetical protein